MFNPFPGYVQITFHIISWYLSSHVTIVFQGGSILHHSSIFFPCLSSFKISRLHWWRRQRCARHCWRHREARVQLSGQLRGSPPTLVLGLLNDCTDLYSYILLSCASIFTYFVCVSLHSLIRVAMAGPFLWCTQHVAPKLPGSAKSGGRFGPGW